MIDKNTYRQTLTFSDSYFHWLQGQNLLCHDGNVSGFQCNAFWLGLPAIHYNDEEWAKLSIEHARNAIAASGGMSEAHNLYFTAPTGVAHSELEKRASALTYMRVLQRGICHVFSAKWLIESGRTDEALLRLCDSATFLGVAYGVAISMTRAARDRARAASRAASAMHSKPGASRSKRDAIRAAWASGKYTSRDVCAEQECAGLNMSFSAARKALRNTSDPT